jgi:hypothetical protein
MSSAGFLLSYYANEAKDRDKAIEYVDKMLYVDPANESLQKIKKDLQAPPKQSTNPPKKNTTPKTGNSSSINNNKQPAVNMVAKE